MVKRISFPIYKITLLLLFISSMYPWFLWDMPIIYIYAFGAIFSLLFYISNRGEFALTAKKMVLNSLLAITLIWNGTHGNLNAIISHLFLFFTIATLINTRDDLKVNVLRFITNGMAILVGLSLIIYALFLLNVPLPHVTIGTTEVGYSGINYYAFITDENITEYYRFRSIFAEPGHLTMGLVLLLFANHFNLRNGSVLILFIAELFTLSLAGYISLILSIIFFALSLNIKVNRIARVLLMFVILFIVLINSKLSENNIINQAIISRLDYDKSTGTIAGYNRTKAYTDTYYDNFIKSSDKIIGLESKKFSSITYGSAGYKVYTIRYGLIGLILAISFYLVYTLSYLKYEILGFFIILILLLFQNGYPFWFAVIFSFILGVANLALDEKKNKELTKNQGRTKHLY